MSPHKAALVLSWGPPLGSPKPLGRGQPSAGSPAYLVCYPRFATILRPETSVPRGDHPTHQKVAQLLSRGPSLGHLKSLGYEAPRTGSPAYRICSNAHYTRQAAEARHSAMMRANSPPARSNSWGGPASMMLALSITITWSAMPIMAGRWVMTTVV